jgi:hypothetical protein
MHGTLLDQRVFESLVHKCLPIIHDHFQEVDVQLSVWYVSSPFLPFPSKSRIATCLGSRSPLPLTLFRSQLDFQTVASFYLENLISTLFDGYPQDQSMLQVYSNFTSRLRAKA